MIQTFYVGHGGTMLFLYAMGHAVNSTARPMVFVDFVQENLEALLKGPASILPISPSDSDVEQAQAAIQALRDLVHLLGET